MSKPASNTRRTAFTSVVLAACLGGAVACSTPERGEDAGRGGEGRSDAGAGAVDAGAADAGAADAGGLDAGGFDGGAFDAGGFDAGGFDAGGFDAGAFDAGGSDAGSDDAGTGDAGAGDAGTFDGGSDDAGSGDAGSGDAGTVDVCGLGVLDMMVSGTQDGETWSITGATAGATLLGDCGGNGEEAVVAFNPPTAGRYVLSTDSEATDYDTVVHVRSTCTESSTELGCSDDIGGGNLNSQLTLTLGANESVFIIVDSYQTSTSSGTFELSVTRVPEVAIGGACDVKEAENYCASGAFCYDDDVASEAGLCAAATPPVLGTGALAYRNGLDGSLVVPGTDASKDVLAIGVELFEGSTVLELNTAGETRGLVDLSEPVWGQEAFTARARMDELFEGTLADATGINVWLVDSTGATSAETLLTFMPIPTVAVGDVCDGEGVSNACATDSTCKDPDEDETFHCMAIYPPTLTGVEVFNRTSPPGIGVRMTGEDQDGDLAGFDLEFLDAADTVIDVGNNGTDPYTLPFTYLDQSNGTYIAEWAQLALEISDLAKVRVTVFDDEGARAGPMIGTLAPTSAISARGDHCDLVGALSTCVAGDACFDATENDANDPVCVEAVAACPAEWTVGDLTAATSGTGWSIDGTTEGSETRGGGSCGGGSGEAIFSFVPPTTGDYDVEVSSNESSSDTLLYVRRACQFAYPSPSAELACNDDVDTSGGNYDSELTVALEAGVTYYVFVDGYRGSLGGWTGTFTLTVAPTN